MNAHQFNDQFAEKVKSERKMTLEILQNILRAEDEKFHLELGFSSLFDWLTRGHGYSESAAQRRIQSARLLRSLPELSEKLKDGQTNLTNLAKVQSVIRAHEKIGPRISNLEKSRVIAQIENKSSFEAERTLMDLFPEVAGSARIEKKTVINADTIRLSLNFTQEQMQRLDRVRELLSHTLPNASLADVVSNISDEYLDRNDPLRKPPSTAATAKRCVTERVQSANVAAVARHIRRLTIQKAEGRCEFRDPKTGRVCGSRFRIETDHIVPRALGGENIELNLRCLCRAHNQFMTEKWLGNKVANRWRTTRS